MKLIFAGTPEFAAQALRSLILSGHDIALVLTQPDRPAGRGMNLAMSPVKQLALAHGLMVLQPANLRNAATQDQLRALDAEVMVVAAYGLILPKEVLAIPRRGCVNIHASLLPRWRGAAPIQRAILAGDRETGITIMQMDEGLDTGPMLMKYSTPIEAEDNAQTLHDRLAILGGEAIVSALALMNRGILNGEVQVASAATYAAKLTKTEARLDFTRPACELERAVRAYNPFPVAQVVFSGQVWRIWKAISVAQCGSPGEILRAGKEGIVVGSGDGGLILLEIQKAGGKRLPAAQFLQGNPVSVGDCFDA